MQPENKLLSCTAQVTILAPVLSSASGGIATSIPALAKEISHRGYSLNIVGLSDPQNPSAARSWGSSVHAHKVFPPKAFGFAPKLEKTLQLLKPNIVNVQGLWLYPGLANLRHHLKTGTPYIITPHGMLDPWARERSVWKKRLVRVWFEDAHLRKAACLHATAKMEAGHFRSFGLRNPIAIVPNGIELPSLRPERPVAKARRMLFLSRLHPKKGIAILLRAWEQLEVTYPDWSLIIAGPDELGHKLEMQALAVRLGLSRVEWFDAVQGEEKFKLYRSSDCFVLPTHAENFGLVVAEALAHEVPVITTKNAPWQGLDEFKCGWWVPLTQRDLFDAMADAMARPSIELHAMGRRGRDWMQRDFGWDGVADRMMTLYEWVTTGCARPSFVEVD